MSCKKCLVTAQQGGDVNVLPRLQIMELCVITLLNLAEWEYLAKNNFQKRFRYLELTSAISLACLDVVQFKGNKKFSKECWDLSECIVLYCIVFFCFFNGSILPNVHLRVFYLNAFSPLFQSYRLF